jgi:D-sedoheptulose 7-phosphate isomerase
LNKEKFSDNLSKIVQDKYVLLKKINQKSDIIYKIVEKITEKVLKDGKIFFCGNGGSASDSQHLATEFLIRLKPNLNRTAIPAMSLTLDSTALTACGNDFGFENIFARALEGLGNKKDILIVISTSGNSKNIIKVLKKAKKMKIFTIGLLGNKGGKAKNQCDLPLVVNHNRVDRIQEMHIFLGHLIAETVELNLLKKKKSKTHQSLIIYNP